MTNPIIEAIESLLRIIETPLFGTDEVLDGESLDVRALTEVMPRLSSGEQVIVRTVIELYTGNGLIGEAARKLDDQSYRRWVGGLLAARDAKVK